MTEVAAAIFIGCCIIAYFVNMVANAIDRFRSDQAFHAEKVREHLAILASMARMQSSREAEAKEAREDDARRARRDAENTRAPKPTDPGFREFRS